MKCFGIAVIALLLAAPCLAWPESVESTAREILEGSDFQGGLIVHLDCGDGKLTAVLGAGASDGGVKPRAAKLRVNPSFIKIVLPFF